MKVKLTDNQLSEINGSWLFFESCPFGTAIKSINDLDAKGLEWVGMQCDDYITLAETNVDYARSEGDKEGILAWSAYKKMLINMRTKVDTKLEDVC